MHPHKPPECGKTSDDTADLGSRRRTEESGAAPAEFEHVSGNMFATRFPIYKDLGHPGAASLNFFFQLRNTFVHAVDSQIRTRSPHSPLVY